MSSNYKKSEDVPTEVLCARLDEIKNAITASDGGQSLLRACTMSVPVDRDADLVLSEIARRLRELVKINEEYGETPNSDLPPLAEGPTKEILVTVNVPNNWEERLDMQWVLEREIHADRWSWNCPEELQE